LTKDFFTNALPHILSGVKHKTHYRTLNLLEQQILNRPSAGQD
jgi:hypothetical protein